MAEIKRAQRISEVAGVKAALEQAEAYKQMLEREAAAKAEQEAQHAAEEQAIGTQIGALVEAAYIVASADGNYTSTESQRLVGRVGALTEDKFSDAQLEAMANDAAGRVSAEGLQARAQSIASTLSDPELRRATLLVASAVAWLDGGVGQKEGLALQALARAFGFSIDELHKIMSQAHG
ncbi:tellurite resistance TerB family protein [Polyangium aurulentum]|uniref:tellurite resistance TerB family protein n=1 Tax=Polyangium aurulentum TaxID=2567896 RepID=UPI0010ADBA15|nr:tellurite resistance TerB family protein [Polyangium aurulentum]UQA55151.1 tellurite resistance TerB family protein [Polyangium aurulentum]